MLSRTQIAVRMGVNRSQVTRWTKGAVPALPVLARLAEILGIERETLLVGERDLEPGARKKSDDESLLRKYEVVLRTKLRDELRRELAEDLKRAVDRWAKKE